MRYMAMITVALVGMGYGLFQRGASPAALEGKIVCWQQQCYTVSVNERQPTPQTVVENASEEEANVVQVATEREAWAFDLLTRLGNASPSGETVVFVVAWTQAEDRSDEAFGRFNPLNTTQPMDGDWIVNSHGVRGYRSYEDGMQATVATLQEERYRDVLVALVTNNPEAAIDALAASPWGTHANVVLEVYHEALATYQPVTQAPSAPVGAKARLTDTMHVSTPYHATGQVWCDVGQLGCQHYGTDYDGTDGTPVYAPFDMVVIARGAYPPGPTFGEYIQGTLPDGHVLYLGHLRNMPAFPIGATIPAGTQIGVMNEFAHVHAQLAPPGVTGPCASDGTCLDFEQYWSEH